MIETISTDELFKQIKNNPDLKILDIRSVDAYNGWKLQEEIRGGHIRNAQSLPFKWINYIDWIEIVHSKNIMPSDSLVLYGYQKNEIEKVARQFNKAGFQKIKMYLGFVNEWSSNEKFPMEQLANYQKLVSPNWLYKLIFSGTSLEYNNDKYVLCHTHYRNKKAYEEGHIPGAIELDTNSLESSQTWNRRSPRELKKTVEKLGISFDSTVILYGRFSFPDNNDPFPGSSAGHLGAFRCALIMMYAGVKDVRILNGGLQSWIDEGFEITTKETEKKPITDFGCQVPACPEVIVDMAEAKEILEAKDRNLVSVRSWSEYIGEVSGYNYIKKKGRIPGSVFGNCGSDAYHMENYRNLDHTTREFHEIEKIWAEKGITPDRYNAFYCGTGWRGSEAFFNAWLMGWPNISIYDGGWFEWSNDDSNPYETGKPR